jgi:hypothetical protein
MATRSLCSRRDALRSRRPPRRTEGRWYLGVLGLLLTALVLPETGTSSKYSQQLATVAAVSSVREPNLVFNN